MSRSTKRLSPKTEKGWHIAAWDGRQVATPSDDAGAGSGICWSWGLVFGSASLFQATQLSLKDMREEAALIRERQARRKAVSDE
jgi:hypothetical protein